MICKNCGNNIPDNVTFCSKCGTPVKQENETVKTVKNKNGRKKGLLIAIVSVTVVVAVILVAVFVSQRNTTNDDFYNEVDDNYNEIDDSYNDDSGNEQNYEEPIEENGVNNFENSNASTELNFYYEKDAQLPYISKTEVPQGFIGIYTVEDLLNSDINQNENYILMTDLDLSSIENWTGITNKAIFDGNGHSISNLKSYCSGLFSSAQNVSALSLIDIEISAQINHKGTLGGICNTLRGSLSGCSVSGQINCDYYGEDRGESYANVGGLVGRQLEGGSIDFCKNYALIFMEAPIGYAAAVGGIAGAVMKINDCINYGEICLETEPSDGLDNIYTLEVEMTATNPEIQDDAGAGGISGITSYGDIKIDACRNEGLVYSNNAAGGILGCAHWDASDSICITNCSNIGQVLGYGENDGVWKCSVGGIVGTGNTNGSNSIENCFNSGNVGSHKEYFPDYDVTYIGAIIGYEGGYNGPEVNFSISNCVYSTSLTQASAIGALYSSCVGISDAEMKEINNYNFTNINLWKNSPTANSPYPFYIYNCP